jgi:chromate transport protein ChrA
VKGRAVRVDVSTSAVFRVALYYGFAGFGGGYSVLAQLRRDLVERRKWLSACWRCSGGLVRVVVPIGVMTFGGGLAMIPAIDHMVVSEQGWLGPKVFADAIALRS